MSTGVEKAIYYFEKKGLINTDKALEIALACCEECGYITPDEEVVVIGGSHHGADTAVVLKPAYAADMFETRIKQLLCMPM
jgi:hypothetical protein